MTQYALIDSGNMVINVIDAADDFMGTEVSELLCLQQGGARWHQINTQPSTTTSTSTSTSVEPRPVGIGCVYNEELGCFVLPKPWPSWMLNSTGSWSPPVPRPVNLGPVAWDETGQCWVQVPPRTLV